MKIAASALAMVICAFAGAEVALLEAFHIAEIRTAKAVSGYEMGEYKGVEHYIVSVDMGDSERRFWIHKGHGRVAKVEAVRDGAAELVEHWPGIKVVAHRGGVGLGVPENTLPAIEKAIEAGAQVIEIDIRATKDGHLVLMHDETVNRTTDGRGRIDELTLDEVKALDAGSWYSEEFAGTKVLTLEEALEAMKGRIDPDLDNKTGGVEQLVEVVQKVGIADQCTHLGSHDSIRRIRELEPRIFHRPGVDYAEQIPPLAYGLKPALINMDWNAVTKESIRTAHVYGCLAFVNCLESADTLLNARVAALAGADYIQTDYPDKVITMLEELGLMYDPSLDIGERVNYLTNPRLRYPLR